MKKYISIKTKYVATVFLIVFCFAVVVSTVWSKMYHSQLFSSTADIINQTMYMKNSSFDETLRNIQYNIIRLNYDSSFKAIIQKESYDNAKELVADRRVMNSILMAAASNSSSIKDIVIVAGNGEDFELSSLDAGVEQIEAFKEQIRAGSGNCIFMAKEKRYEKSNVDILMAILLNEGKRSEALVLITVDLKSFLEGYNSNLDYDLGYAVYDPVTKTVIKEQKLGEIDYSKDVDFSHITKEYGDYTVDKLHGQKYMVMSYVSPLTGWETVIHVPINQLTRKYLSGTYLNYIVILISVMVAGIVSYIMAKAMTQNLVRLTKTIKKIDSAALAIPQEEYSNDEIGDLYKKFCEMMDRIRNQMQTIQREEKEKRKYEIKALQVQINPHFLHNSLGVIRYLAQMQGMENIMEVTDALTNIMHTNMSERDQITLLEEKRYLESYIEMYEYRYARPIDFTCEIEPGLESVKILKILIQPLVENAVKHGKIMEKSNGFISVRMYGDNGRLAVIIKDNGSGISEERMKEAMEESGENDHIGLFNIARRIRLNYGEPYGIHIDSEEGFYTVITLTLPLTGKEKEAGDDSDIVG